jgi:uncharacterized integral membrane protein
VTEVAQPEMYSEPAQVLDDPRARETAFHHENRRTRISAVWIGTIAAALVLVMLLVFILQNTRSVRISYLGASGTMPLGVALLFAAVGGLLFASLVSSLRIWQLRRVARWGTVRPHRVTRADQSLADQGA